MSILGMCLSFEASTLSYIYPQTPSRTIPNRKMIAMQTADLRSAMFSFGIVSNIRKKPPGGGFEADLLWIFVFAQESVVESLDRELYDVVVCINDEYYAGEVVDPVVEIWIPVNVAIVLVEAEVVFGVDDVVVNFFVADCNDERYKVLVVRNG